MRQFEITKENENGRLDKFLLKFMNTAPKSFVYKMLRKKNIKLNGKKAEGNEILKCGDVVTIYISDETLSNFTAERTIKKSNIQIDVVYEDENVIICNKPVGVLSQGSESNDENINDALLYYLHKKGEYMPDNAFKPGICNRLDRNTGGIVVMGKNPAAARELNAAFKNKAVEKYYIAVVKGNLQTRGKILGWHSKEKGNKAVIYSEEKPNTSFVETHYKPIKSKNGYTLAEIRLVSGKSHQIRVSMESIGFPLVGDVKYGSKAENPFNARHQILYAYRLVFTQPRGIIAYLKGKEFKINKDKMLNCVWEYFR